MRTLVAIGGMLVAGLAACGSSPGADLPGARVTRVIDGDTVVMERLGKVRLIGVNTPEKERCFDDAATRFTRERLEDQVVQYEVGEEPEDRYQRTLAYLWREGEMHNVALLREGYARVLTIPPNDKYAAGLERAERDAKKGDAGLWEKCDRDKIRARRAAAKRRKAKAEARRIAAAERRAARRVRRAAAAQARRERARRAARRVAARRAAEDDAGGSAGGGSCGPGDIDGDSDGVCNEGSSGGGSSGSESSAGGSSGFACGPGDIDGDNDGRCNE